MSHNYASDSFGGVLNTDIGWSTGLAGLGAFLSVAAGWFVFGPLGAIAGGVLVAAWLVFSPIVVVALGHVLFTALLPAEPSLATIAIIEGPLAVLLVGSVLNERAPLRSLGIGSIALIALTAIVASGLAWIDALWHTAVLLVGVVALVGYVLHRYTVAVLEVTDEH